MNRPISSAEDAPPRPRRTVHVVLPAYNEQRRIGALLEHIDVAMEEAGLRYEVTVVDDGSTDETASIVRRHAERMPIHLRRHERNQGLGATLRDGLFDALDRSSGRDVIVTMDADDTHSPGLVLRMVRMISEGYDVVVASRYQPGSRAVGVPFSRRALSYGGSWLLRILFPIPGIRDYTCGYRAYRAAALKEATAEYGDSFVDQEGFQCMVDILLKLRTRNLHFGEVPFLLRYDVKQGGSKMNVPRTIQGTLRLLVRRRLGR